MKNIRQITLLVLLTMGAGNGMIKAQGLEQGKVLIDLYYGFPNLWTGLIKTVVNQEMLPINLQTNTLGPLGGRVEYLVTDRLGLGIDVYYAQSGVAFAAEGLDLDGNPAIYAYDIQFKRPRVLARLNYHFGNSEAVDPYVAAGIGYNASRIVIKTSDPIFQQNTISLPAAFPVAFRLAFGTRVMLSPIFGFGMELGLGGPLLTTGLTLKI